MKKIFIVVFLMLTACGVKNQDINPLGGVNSEVISTSFCTTESIQTTSIIEENDNSEKEVFIDVPYYSQEDYPTGCELVSTSMLLAFYGFELDAGEIISEGYLSSVDVTKKSDGLKYSGNPDKVFIGNPQYNTGYGCYSGAIILALQRYFAPLKYKLDENYQITDLKGTSIRDICDEYINNGIPILLWASIDMKPTFQRLSNSWIIEKTGEHYIWKSNEHCLVLVGYDEEYYYFNDPLAGKDIPYLKPVVERRYNELGMQAVAIEVIP